MYKQFTILNHSFNSIDEIDKLKLHPFDNLKFIKKKIEEHNIKVIDKSLFYKHLFLETDINKSLIEFISEENNKVKNEVIVYFLEKINKENKGFITNEEQIRICVNLLINYEIKYVDKYLEIYNNFINNNFIISFEFYYKIMGKAGLIYNNKYIEEMYNSNNPMFNIVCVALLRNKCDTLSYILNKYKLDFYKKIDETRWCNYSIGFSKKLIEYHLNNDYEVFSDIMIKCPLLMSFRNVTIQEDLFIIKPHQKLMRTILCKNNIEKYNTLYLIMLFKEMNYEYIEYLDKNIDVKINVICRGIFLLLEKFPTNLNLRNRKISFLKKIINLFIDRYEEKIVEVFQENINALASAPYSLKIFKILDKYGLNFNVKDTSGYTPLLDAAKYGDFETFLYLKKKTYPSLIMSPSKEHDCFNIIVASCINTDFRILKYICQNKTFFENIQIYYYLDELFSNDTIDNIFITNNCFINKHSKHVLPKLIILKKTFPEVFKDKFLKLIIYSNIDPDIICDMYQNEKIEIKNNNDYKYASIDFNSKVLFKNFFKNKRIIKLLKDDISRFHFLDFLVLNAFKFNDDVFNKTFDYLIDIISLQKINIKYRYDLYLSALKSINNVWYKEKRYARTFEKIFKYLLLNKLDLNNSNTITAFFDGYLFSNYHYLDYIVRIHIVNGMNIRSQKFIDICIKSNYYRKMFIYSFDIVIKWNKCFHVLKKCIKKRNFSNLKKYKVLNNEVINEIDYFPNDDSIVLEKEIFRNIGRNFKNDVSQMFIRNKKLPPQHINPLNINNFLKTNNILTQKIDGLHIKDNVSSNDIDFYPEIDFNIDTIEFEYVEKDNIYYIIDTCNEYYDIDEFNLMMRKMHRFVKSNNTFIETINHLKLIDIMKTEKDNIDQYKIYMEENLPCKTLWWPKLVFKSRNDVELLSDLKNIKDLEYDIYDTDGWILTDINNRKSLKIKPDKHITIDLLYKNMKFYTGDRIAINHVINNINDINNENNKFIDNTIYRCYFDDKKKAWIPRDIRNDKKNPNYFELENELYKYHTNKWCFDEIIEMLHNKPYYQKNLKTYYKKHFKLKWKSIKEKILELDNTNILDIGCGYKTDKLLDKTNYKFYCGIDNDLGVIKPICKNKHFYLMNIEKDWSLKDQSKINILYNHYSCDIKQTFDTIYSINTIQYAAKDNKMFLRFIKNIDQRSRKNTKLLINYLDFNLLNKIFIDTDCICFNNSFVKKLQINDNDDNITNNWIRLYYDWCHVEPCKEPVLSEEIIMNNFKNLGWKLYYRDNYPKLDHDDPFINYFNCFRKIILQKY